MDCPVDAQWCTVVVGPTLACLDSSWHVLGPTLAIFGPALAIFGPVPAELVHHNCANNRFSCSCLMHHHRTNAVALAARVLS